MNHPYRFGAGGPLSEASERYHNDPRFHALVDMLMSQVIELEMTPHEIRQAATFACVRLAERYPGIVPASPSGGPST